MGAFSSGGQVEGSLFFSIPRHMWRWKGSHPEPGANLLFPSTVDQLSEPARSLRSFSFTPPPTMSLLSSIFGGGGGSASTKKNLGGGLNGLFDGTAKLESLEEKKKVSAAAQAAKDALKKQQQKKKKKKREESDSDDDSSSSDDDASSSDGESDASPPEETEEKDEPKKKKRKEKKSDDTSSVTAAATQEDDEEDTDKNGDRTIFVGNLPPSTTRKSLVTMFKPCGKVESTRLRSIAVEGVKLPPEKAGDQNLMRKVCVNTKKVSTDTPKKTVQGYVVFVSADSVTEALKMNNKAIKADGMNLRLRVDRSKPSNDSTRSVFVGNLPYAADEASLRDHFIAGCEMEDNDVEGVRIIRDAETQQCKGFGYVLLSDRSHVAAALQMHDTEYMRRNIRVMVCGKRFKGKKGRVDAPADGEGSSGKSRKFEGRRATEVTGGARRVSGKKRKHESSSGPSTGAASFLKAGTSAGGKKKRMRGAPSSEKNKFKAGGRKAGVSKRAAAEAKANKRVKQLKKRLAKGMGKSK